MKQVDKILHLSNARNNNITEEANHCERFPYQQCWLDLFLIYLLICIYISFGLVVSNMYFFLIRKTELNGYHCMYRFVECIAFYLLHVYKMTMAKYATVYYCVSLSPRNNKWRKLNWPK